MKQIKIDLSRAKERFPERLRGTSWHTREERRYLSGRMPADQAREFVAWHRRQLEDQDDNEQLRALTERRAELVRQLAAGYSLPVDELVTADPAQIGQEQQTRAGAAELVRVIDGEIAKMTERALAQAERQEFARLVIRLADVTDDHERAEILDEYDLLSETSRRQFLPTMPINQQRPDRQPDRLTG